MYFLKNLFELYYMFYVIICVLFKFHFLNKTNYIYFLELKKAEEKIQELIKQKLEMEETLYYKFLNLLNAKKEKIRELEDQGYNRLKIFFEVHFERNC